MKFTRQGLAVTLALCLGACGLAAATKDAGRLVEEFHSRLDAGNLDAIWKDGDNRLHGSGSKADFDHFLTAFRQRLGKVVSAKQVGWHSNVTTGGTFVTLVDETVFERGKATETFDFVGTGNDMKLLGYHINSDAFLDPAFTGGAKPPPVIIAMPPSNKPSSEPSTH